MRGLQLVSSANANQNAAHAPLSITRADSKRNEPRKRHWKRSYSAGRRQRMQV